MATHDSRSYLAVSFMSINCVCSFVVIADNLSQGSGSDAPAPRPYVLRGFCGSCIYDTCSINQS